MAVLILGINHRSAPVAIREQVAFEPRQLPDVLTDLCARPGVDGAVIVSTCNRTELYCDVSDGADTLSEWLCAHRGLSGEAREALYRFDDDTAVRHVFEVACGLDSMVLGETQILGQVKQAYATARDLGFTSPTLNLLFQRTFAVAKRVRTDTRIGASPVSVASAAVALAQRIFAGFENRTALLIGAGEIIELTARHLHAQSLGRLIVANRSVERARTLALQFGGFAISLGEIAAHLHEADIVISSTAAPQPLVRADMVAAALRGRRRRPMFIVDMAVPRDVETDVADFDDIYLYTVDDLHDVIEDSHKIRSDAAEEAGEMIDEAVLRFRALLARRENAPLIRQLRETGVNQRDRAVAEARRLLAAGRDPDEVIEMLAHTLTNRLLHLPSSRLQRAAEEADDDLRRAAAELFGLDPPEVG